MTANSGQCCLNRTQRILPRGQALSTIGPAIQWQHSYVAGNKTFCIYLADGEDSIRKHAELSGIPIAKITEVPQIIDPLTANN